MEISIIIPAYNVEKYIGRCLDSLLCQRFDRYEIIVIDDCSTDRTADILQEYQKKSSVAIRYYRNKINLKAASCRKQGLMVAQGKYVIFVDADDWIEGDMFEKLYNRAEETNADIVFCGIHRENERGSRGDTVLPSKILLGIRGKLGLSQKKALAILNPTQFWGKIYKKNFLTKSGFEFMEGMGYDEDTVEVLLPLLADSIDYIDEDMYVWFMREGSVMRDQASHTVDRGIAAERLLESAEKLGLYREFKEELDYVIIRNFYMASIDIIQSFIENEDFALWDLEYLSQSICKNEEKIFGNYYYKLLVSKNMKKSIFYLKEQNYEGFKDFYYSEYIEYYSAALDKVKVFLEKEREMQHKVALWGGGKKLRCLFHVLGMIPGNICCVYDTDDRKWGKRIRGIEIKEYEAGDGCDTILVMSSGYVDSVLDTVQSGEIVVDFDKYILYGLI